MNLSLPNDYHRCLGHPPADSDKPAPKSWCARIQTCARHQTISFDDPAGRYNVARRLCTHDDDGLYIETER